MLALHDKVLYSNIHRDFEYDTPSNINKKRICVSFCLTSPVTDSCIEEV
jgi:hypothetical protein